MLSYKKYEENKQFWDGFAASTNDLKEATAFEFEHFLVSAPAHKTILFENRMYVKLIDEFGEHEVVEV